MIRDLLPLYKDQACSKASAEAVEEHLAECPDCTGLLEEMNSFNIEETIKQERNDVIKTQAKYFKRKSAIVGTVIGAVFSLPILICLIVDLVSGSGLSWFFIVLAAMLILFAAMVAAAFILAGSGPSKGIVAAIAAFMLVLLWVGYVYIYIPYRETTAVLGELSAGSLKEDLLRLSVPYSSEMERALEQISYYLKNI